MRIGFFGAAGLRSTFVPASLSCFRLFQIADQLLFRRQVGERRDAPELIGRTLALEFVAEHQLRLPEAEDAVLLERRHPAEHSLVVEVRRLPLDAFGHVGHDLVHRRAQILEDRLGVVGRLGDVRVDARVSCAHGVLPEMWNDVGRPHHRIAGFAAERRGEGREVGERPVVAPTLRRVRIDDGARAHRLGPVVRAPALRVAR